MQNNDFKITIPGEFISTNKYKFLIVLILLVSLLIRLYNISFGSLWYDELHSASLADPEWPFIETLKWYQPDCNLFDGTPPLFNLLLRFFSLIFGYNDFTIRLLPVFIGVFSIYVIYKLGQVLFNKNVGILAAAITSVSPFHIQFSLELRSYGLFMLFSMLSFLFLYKFFEDKSNKNLLYFTLSNIIVLYSHYFSFIYFASVGLVFIYLLFEKKNYSVELYKKLLFSGALSFIAYLPWLSTLIKYLKIEKFWIEKPSSDFFVSIFNFFLGQQLLVIYLVVALFLIFITSILHDKYEEKVKTNTLMITFFILISLIIPYLKSIISIPVIQTRYLIFIFGFIIILISSSINFLKISRPGKVFVVLILILLYSSQIFIIKKIYIRSEEQDWREMTAYIAKNNNNQSTVLCESELVNHFYFKLYSPETPFLTLNFENFIKNFISNINKSKIEYWTLEGPYGKPIDQHTQNFFINHFKVQKDSVFKGNCKATLFEFNSEHLKEHNNYSNDLNVKETNSITKNIEFSYYDQTSGILYIEGWAFITSIDNSIPSKLILIGNNSNFVFETNTVLRSDLNPYFNKTNINNSGFCSFINTKNIPKDNYKLAIKISNNGIDNYSLYDKTIEIK